MADDVTVMDRDLGIHRVWVATIRTPVVIYWWD